MASQHSSKSTKLILKLTATRQYKKSRLVANTGRKTPRRNSMQLDDRASNGSLKTGYLLLTYA